MRAAPLKFAHNYNRSPCYARRRGRKPEEMRECFGAIPATDEGFIRRLYRTRPEVLRRVLIPLLAMRVTKDVRKLLAWLEGAPVPEAQIVAAAFNHTFDKALMLNFVE